MKTKENIFKGQTNKVNIASQQKENSVFSKLNSKRGEGFVGIMILIIAVCIIGGFGLIWGKKSAQENLNKTDQVINDMWNYQIA